MQSRLVGLIIIVSFAWFASGAVQSDAPSNSLQEKDHMSQHAAGPFDVKTTPQQPDNDDAKAANLGRMSLDKQYHGDLDAIGKGEGITVRTEVKGSAGYVAIERVTGSLRGKKGSFVLQHNATMNRGATDLNIIVVPDSGTGELKGISGKMNIIVAPGGKHSYEFDYTIE